MNFQALKWMIDNLVKTFKCPECSSNVSEENVEIMGTAWTNINIDIWCPSCEKHSMIKAEVMSIDFRSLNIAKGNLSSIKDNLMWLQNKLEESKKKNSIKDENIIELNKNLRKKDFNVDDLLAS